MNWRWTFLLTGLVSCAQFISMTDDGYNEKVPVSSGNSQISVVFSHNINGETQPCGCRNFPLGGLEQVAGHFHQLHAKGPVVYVDTGDAFFPSPAIPENVQKSLSYTARELHNAFEALGLKFFVPGDQDFAMGVKWLSDLSHEAHYVFLIANLAPNSPFKARPWARLTIGEKKLLFIGVVDPELLSPGAQGLFTAPEDAIAHSLKAASPQDDEVVILLSHSGMDADKKLATRFPRLNWIIGAHSQSYTTSPTDEGTTQLVQVLSRNHFLGHIGLGLGNKDTKTTFELLETREEMSKVVEPNPLATLMTRWRTNFKEIQSKEQGSTWTTSRSDPLPTFNSCLDCHAKQTKFWQGTAHASAWHTLQIKGSDNDPSCVGCHSVGWQNEQGFKATPERVRFENVADMEKLKLYTADLGKLTAKVQSVRKMAASERTKLSDGQLRIMKEHKVTHDYGHVQCLNCHDKTREHPFDGTTTMVKVSETACLTCHTKDQSPEWYQGGKPNHAVVQQNIQKVACPK